MGFSVVIYRLITRRGDGVMLCRLTERGGCPFGQKAFLDAFDTGHVELTPATKK